jgi:hypothetical protein
MKYVTPKTFPIGDDGRFQSEPAEFAYQAEAVRLGITREDFRLILQAFVCKSDECQKRYDAWVAAGRPR